MSQPIDPRMTIQQLLRTYPQTAAVLARFNLGCIGCMGAAQESIEHGATAHGLDLDELLRALNNAIAGN